MDYCPFVIPWIFGKCAQPAGTASTYVQGFNVFSDAARCFDGDFRPKVSDSVFQFYKGLCGGVMCNEKNESYTVTVYSSGGTYVPCPPGENISLNLLSDAFEVGSHITCPSYTEVCQGNVKAAIDNAEAHDTQSSQSSSSGEASDPSPSSSFALHRHLFLCCVVVVTCAILSLFLVRWLAQLQYVEQCASNPRATSSSPPSALSPSGSGNHPSCTNATLLTSEHGGGNTTQQPCR
ncbi:putative Major surface protease gp63 [Leptomonas seymouri]|uniref:Leishmanolysin n=1 Tax=Leptomonas seymouri TaxID=5684 RepID=A0A0N1IG81_LEPSE|nr:putative Major surface protease gp63 [Leptomonas seymouri]|eukprot:KPI82740.1 putative Major surface protease gp63 [Leptomonas seymouri]